MLTVAPGARSPTAHSTATPEMVHAAPVTSSMIASKGRVSVSCTSRATDGPRLPTLIVNVGRPAPAGAEGVSVTLVTARSAAVLTSLRTVVVFPDGAGSGVDEVTVAVLASGVPAGVAAGTVAWIVNVGEAPGGRDPTVQVTSRTPVKVHPAGRVIPLSPVGSWSVMTTPAAVEGPLLTADRAHDT